MERWKPAVACSAREERILKLAKQRKLFGFLRRQRHLLFDDAFQEELEGMYRNTGAGSPPVPPALMCMALLLQGYSRVSDHDAVFRAGVDAAWQMVLGCLGAEEAPFSQGGLQQFRERLIAHDMDRRLLERTVELARKTKEFDWKKLPKDLRLVIDSSPFEGAGRVEDTFNLLGHAARKVVQCVSRVTGVPVDDICESAGIPVLTAPSIKTGLDVDWNDHTQKAQALGRLVVQLNSLERWLDEDLDGALNEVVKAPMATLRRIKDQNLQEPVNDDAEIADGVAKDRQVSIEDPEMRHGRKSKSKLFNGYKRHIGTDLDTGLILACSITPANQPEALGADPIKADVDRLRRKIGELHHDLGYLHSQVVGQVLAAGGDIVSKPWPAKGRDGRLGKEAFHINIRNREVTCPAGQTRPFRLGQVVVFDAEVCGQCRFREQCTTAPDGKGRTLSIAEDEPLQQRLRKRLATKSGRQRLRQRVCVEHRLAHVSQRQGRRARFRGTRKNLMDLRRTAAILNLEQIQLRIASNQ